MVHWLTKVQSLTQSTRKNTYWTSCHIDCRGKIEQLEQWIPWWHSKDVELEILDLQGWYTSRKAWKDHRTVAKSIATKGGISSGHSGWSFWAWQHCSCSRALALSWKAVHCITISANLKTETHAQPASKYKPTICLHGFLKWKDHQSSLELIEKWNKLIRTGKCYCQMCMQLGIIVHFSTSETKFTLF